MHLWLLPTSSPGIEIREDKKTMVNGERVECRTKQKKGKEIGIKIPKATSSSHGRFTFAISRDTGYIVFSELIAERLDSDRAPSSVALGRARQHCCSCSKRCSGCPELRCCLSRAARAGPGSSRIALGLAPCRVPLEARSRSHADRHRTYREQARAGCSRSRPCSSHPYRV